MIDLSEASESRFCMSCGTKNDATSKFCIKCGKSLAKVSNDGVEYADEKTESQQKSTSVLDTATSYLNGWTGGEGAIKVSWRDFFSEVLKKHTNDEAEAVFIVGTKTTTPSLSEIKDDKVRPWLFSRILLMIIVAGVLLTVLNSINQNMGDQVAVDVVFAVAVPLAALVLFFEINVYKNISFYRVVTIMLIGGITAIVFTVALRQILNISGLNFVGALTTGAVEEAAKILIAAYFVHKLNVSRIFNGLLIGAAVGTGFAVFENIQYMMVGVQNGTQIVWQLVSTNTALIRTLFSIADHTEWCAIATAALVIAKGNHRLTISNFAQPRFIRFFLLVVVIHMFWDWNFLNNLGNVRYAVLAIITWIIVFVLIHAGLREVTTLQLEQKHEQTAMESED